MASSKTKTTSIKLILLVALLFAAPVAARGETAAQVMQTYVSAQTMTAFVNNALYTDALQCTVSNQNAAITAAGLLSDANALVRTTILVDISTSMPGQVRDSVLATLKKMVEGKAAYEAYRIIVFGDALHTLQDFSTDRYDLAAAIENIVFDRQQSIIYDAIFNTIPPMTKIDEQPTFYRTVVITDGVDDTASGITKEELFIKLQNERYPVDVVAVSGEESAENKELAAIVRMSGGRYNALHPATDVADLANALRIDGYFYFEATIPSALMDGTTRQVDISDGVNAISIDVKCPVFNAPAVDTQPTETLAPTPTLTPTATAAPTSAAATSAASTSAPTSAPTTPIPTPASGANKSQSLADLFGAYTIPIIAGIGAVLFIVLGVVAAALLARGRKKNQTAPEPGASASHGTNDTGETEMVSDIHNAVSVYTIKLSHVNDPSQTWTLPVTGELLIGRGVQCAVRLDDKSVSREQCKITIRGDGLAVSHISSTNKTSLNGSTVTESAPIQSGDMLKFGRVALRVDYIQTLGNPPPKQESPPSRGKGKTESIF